MPTNLKVETAVSKMPMKLVDVRVMLDEYDKWTKLYEEIFAAKGR